MVIQMKFNTPKIKVDVNEILEKVKNPMTDDEIEYHLGKKAKNRIISYEDLEKYQYIEQLLPNSFDYIIILVEWKENNGHWICMLRYIDSQTKKATIEIFDPYGNPIVRTLDKIKSDIMRIRQPKQLIVDLVQDALNKNYQIKQNRHQFQSKNSHINTCGRWVILRIVSSMKLKMNNQEFINFIQEQDNKFQLGNDFIVGLLV